MITQGSKIPSTTSLTNIQPMITTSSLLASDTLSFRRTSCKQCNDFILTLCLTFFSEAIKTIIMQTAGNYWHISPGFDANFPTQNNGVFSYVRIQGKLFYYVQGYQETKQTLWSEKIAEKLSCLPTFPYHCYSSQTSRLVLNLDSETNLHYKSLTQSLLKVLTVL